MANRYPLILDTDDNNRLKELPNGDSLNLTGNAIVGVSNISSTGSLSTANISASGNITNAGDITTGGTITATGDINGAAFKINQVDVRELVEYSNLLNAPTFATVATTGSYTDLIDQPTIPTDINQLSDIDNLLAGVSQFTELADTPDVYTGFAGFTLVVNGTENGLSFAPASSITDSEIIAALGYTPYDGNTNPLGFLQSVSLSNITDALGYTPYDGVANPLNFLTAESQTLDQVVQNGSTTNLPITVGGLSTTGNIGAGTLSLSGELVFTTTGIISIDGGVGSSVVVGGTSILSLRSSNNSIEVQAGIQPNVSGNYDLGGNTSRFANSYFSGTVTSFDFASSAASSTFTLAGSMLFQPAATGRVGISQGVFKLPVITDAQRNAITALDGDLIFNNTSFVPEIRQNNRWLPLMPIAGPEPANPWPGMLAVANGTTWNPAGNGNECLMCYLNAAWTIVAQGA